MPTVLSTKKRILIAIATLALILTLAIWLSVALIRSFAIPPDLPQPTQKTVKASNIVGKWQYFSRLHSRIINIDFRADGKFLQVVLPSENGDEIQNSGKWRLNGSHLIMEDILIGIEEGKPYHGSLNWWVIDGRMREDLNAFIVFGGDGSEERYWEHFVRLLEESPSDE